MCSWLVRSVDLDFKYLESLTIYKPTCDFGYFFQLPVKFFSLQLCESDVEAMAFMKTITNVHFLSVYALEEVD